MLLIEKNFKQFLKTVEEQNNVTITHVDRVSVKGKRKSGNEFGFIAGFNYDMTNRDTYNYTEGVDKPFTPKEIERFRNLIMVYLKMELEKSQKKQG